MLTTTFFPEHFIWVAHPKNAKVTLNDVTRSDAIFVSGKLMDPEFIRTLTGHYVPFTAAVARNYARGERGRGKKKTLLLEPRAGGLVLGTMLLKLTQADKDALDKFEQIPQGVRRKVPIRVTVGAYDRTATTFLLNE
jgi:hypothetical protein